MNAAAWTISIIAIAIAIGLALQWERTSRPVAAGVPGRDDATSRFEFMSAPWIAMARSEITRALAPADLDVEPYTLSEEFTDPPTHLGRGSTTIGFSVRVGGGRVEVIGSPAPEADCRIISDYADALAIARDPDFGSVDPADAARRIADGRVRIEGDPGRMPAPLQQVDIHRLLAAHTA